MLEDDANNLSTKIISASEIVRKIENKEKIEYEGYIIKGNIKGNIDDNCPIIEKNIIIKKCIIEGYLDFYRCTIKGDLDLSDTLIKGKNERGASVYFSKTVFCGEVNFENAQFIGDARFRKAKFYSIAKFNDAEFRGNARFSEAIFCGEAKFEKVQFFGDARFRKTMFCGVASFKESEFRGNTKFSEAKLSEEANFAKVQFFGVAGFRETLFNSKAIFKEAQFYKYALFNDTKFKGIIIFDKAEFADALFEGAEFSHGMLSLNKTKYAMLFIRWDVINKIRNKKWMFWDPGSSILDYDEDGKPTPLLDQTYLLLIDNFKKIGFFEDADNCFYYYSYKRNQSLWLWPLDRFFMASYGYGTKPKRPLIWSGIFIVIFSVIYIAFYGLAPLEAFNISPAIFLSGAKLIDTPNFDSIKMIPFWIWTLEKLIGSIFVFLFIISFGSTILRRKW